MLTTAFEYLRTSTDWERTVLIGGLLTVFSFLLIPAFVVMGYLLGVFRATMHGDTERPPVFDDWGALAVDGLKGYVIAFVYGLVPAVVLGGTFVFGFAGLASGSDAGALTGGLVLLAGGLLTAGLWLAVAYVLPAALLNYAETGRLGAGFAVGDITPMLTNRAYMRAFAYALVAGVAFGVVAGLLNVVPVLGAIASAFVGFYVAVTVAYIYGRTYAEMHVVDVADGNAIDENAAI
ncbi:DUF4013 domain-containing protein [Saliphagus sp. LR7]|uniref:DUF4013 domain-containing protein n=1 Tax=Saliphagus sp. LR7 TaxID=2282654 RepID=UPI000DF7BBFE|nr:DUF4013 domain-containing protein [Saliphagus sp. LR7]